MPRYSSVTALRAAVGSIPTELQKELRPRIRAAANAIAADARSRASYSSRIPSAIRVQTSFSKSKPGATIRVDASQAPHARVLERGNSGGRGNTFRHPVFGRDTWVEQSTRPFLFPAVRAGRIQYQRAVSEAIRKAIS